MPKSHSGMHESPGAVTQLLVELKNSQQEAAPKLFDLLYEELRRMAQRYLQQECREHTLQATALIHEAYLRLVDNRQDWQNRAHFFGIASSAMRRVLVDHARAKHAAKRPGSQQRVDLDAAPVSGDVRYDNLIAIDRALERLGQIDRRQERIVELRYFGGLTERETAEILGISLITVQRDWAVAKTWLRAEIAGRRAAP